LSAMKLELAASRPFRPMTFVVIRDVGWLDRAGGVPGPEEL
jgi:hypothetical protein